MMNPFRSLLSLILGSALVLAFAAAGPAVWLYDHKFAGVEWHGPVFGWPSIKLAPGIAVADARALTDTRQAFATERASLYVVMGALDRQNDAVGAWRSAGAKAQAEAAKAVLAQRRAMAHAQDMARVLDQPLDGATACERAQSFDDRFTREISQ